MSPDNEVIARSASEPAAFSVLYDRHATTVFRYAAQRLNDDAADDIMSETFLVAFERRGTFDESFSDARPWLLGIATRLIRKHARLEATAWKGLSADLAAQVAPDFIDQAGARIDAQRLTARLGKAIRRLTDADRDTLLLYAWGDLDYAAIASALEIPVGTVRSRLNRVRRQLRRAAGIDTTEQETDHGRVDTAPQHA
ncbi:sigma-70 family RNA polymerase sigma factor [Microbacterium sp. ARD31]|uniref:RNA polymerase sigma factor n=1 Tax=Microbacterium sp. ARD31 TaxID=2962576 RepID=UPI0028812472|nr:sigma-70 family RNA polymerase sigma factor [Microbacterium sp. ARD31]MDT0182004.1 sigma-70 family RNA polymerase sigma factor [Microbacterium sp. ARD31]